MRGVCPICGERVLIPLSSTRGSRKHPIIEQPIAQPNENEKNNDASVWYLQTTDGQRYGPSTESVMRDWVKDQRIAPNMLIWCNGWADWKAAKDVFPELSSAAQTLNPVPAPSADSMLQARARRLEKQRKAMYKLYLVLGLFGLIAAMLITLLCLLAQQ